jgi:hypothetical protein
MSVPTSNPGTPSFMATNILKDDRDVPKPEDIFIVPVEIVRCLREIAPLIQASGAWWSLGGDLSENLLEVHVRPTEIVILTNADGMPRLLSALSRYSPPPARTLEERLDREAEVDGTNYPIYVRSMYSDLEIGGVSVRIHGEYQMKVGEWEWGDSLYFTPSFVNLAGVQIPLMPLRIKSEMYLMLGWSDRAALVSEAYSRSHAFLHQLMEGTGQ